MKLLISFLPLLIQATPFNIEYRGSAQIAYLLKSEVKKTLFIPEELISIHKGFDKCLKERRNHALLICIDKEIHLFSNKKLINGTYKVFRKLK